MVCDWSGTNERDVRYGRVRCEVVSDVGPANDGLYNVWWVSASFEGARYNGCKVRGRPGCGFGAFDYDGVTGKDGGYDRAYEVVKLELVRCYYLRRRYTKLTG